MNDEPPSLPECAVGRRIAIWGVTGSGKSTLGKALGGILDVPVVELDAIRHERGWESVDWPEFRSRLESSLETSTGGWVVEGGYSAIMDVYLSKIDTLIWLRLPLYTTFPRLVTRCVRRIRSKDPLYGPDGPRESARMTFASRESILLYSLTTHRSVVAARRERLKEVPPGVRKIELTSARAVEGFLDRLRASTRIEAVGSRRSHGAPDA